MADVLAEAVVMLSVDAKNFDKSMDMLPEKARKVINDTIKVIEDKIEQVKLEIPLHAGNTAEIKQLNDYLDQLKANLDAVKMSANQQAQAMSGVAQATQKASRASQQGVGGIKNMGYGLLMVSQAVEDAQYGFSAIVNNIPGIAMAFGAGPGLAGIMSLVSVAINMLINNWSKLTSIFSGSKVKTQAEEMEELRKKTSLTADEAERLARADNLTNKVKTLQGGQSEKSKKSENAATNAVNEAGLQNVIGGIMGTAPEMVDSQGDAAVAKQKIVDLEKKRDAARGRHAGDTTGESYTEEGKLDEQLREARLEQLEARKKTAQDIVASGTLPDQFRGQIKKIAGMVTANPDKFGPGGVKLADDLRKATPEAMDRERDRAQMAKGNRDRRETAEKDNATVTGGENHQSWIASDRLEQAKRNLALAIEADPYNTGTIGRAEDAYQEAIEAQSKLLAETQKRRQKQLDEMSDLGLISHDEKDARQRELDEQETRNKNSTQAAKDQLDESQKRDALKAGAGLEDRYRNQLLRDIGMGKPVDETRLRSKVTDDLVKGGANKEDAAKMAEYIVKDMVEKVGGEVRSTAQHDGVSADVAAKRELAQATDESHAKAYHEGGFSDLSSLYSKLQAGAMNSNQYEQITAESTKQIAIDTREMLNQVKVKQGDMPPPPVAQGPA